MVMEQFEKWWNNRVDSGITIFPQSYADCRDTWIAALKEIEKEKSYDILDVIYTELGDNLEG